MLLYLFVKRQKIMKFKMLFIFLIGMISMTALASTTMLEQKQKTTIQKSLKHFQIVEIVQNEVSFITIDNTSIMERASISHLIKERIVKQLAIIDDVGWNIQDYIFKNNIYLEKMHLNYIPDLREEIRSKKISSQRKSC